MTCQQIWHSGCSYPPIAGSAPSRHCVCQALLDHIGPAPKETGDRVLVEETVAQILANGTGAHRQRTVRDSSGNFCQVFLDAAERTTA